MVEDPSIQHLISWAPSGDVFSVSNPTEFSKLVLPQYFKHNNWQSFVRQLNMYGFHKVNDMFHANPSSESQAWEFKHQDFRRGQPAALQLIKRKSSKHSTNSLRDDRIEYLTNQMKELKEKTRQITENYKVLYDESLSFRMLQISMAKEDDPRRKFEVDFLQAEVAKLAQVDPPSHSSSMIPHYTHPYTPQRTLSTPQPMIGVESAAPPPPSQQQPSEMDYRMTQQQQQQSSSSSSPYPSQHSRTPKINPPSALAKLPEFPFAPSPFQPTSSTSGNLPIIRHLTMVQMLGIINKSSSSLPSSQTRPPPLPDPPDNNYYPLEKSPLCIHWLLSIPPPTIKLSDVAKKLKSLLESNKTNNNKLITDDSINDYNDINNNNNTRINLKESEHIRKSNLFAEIEQDIIEQHITLQQQQAKFICSEFWFSTDEEIAEALEDCNGDEHNSDYFKELRRKIVFKHNKEDEKSTVVHKSLPLLSSQKGPVEEMQTDDDDDKIMTPKRQRKKSTKTTRDSSSHYKHSRMKGRLTLDEAVKQVEKNNRNFNKAFQGWSEARVRAYKLIDKNPNAYYYRFNAPGEEQRLGRWEEEILFFNRLAELGNECQWGIFSMAIPGRVGYQCSNFYRYLIESGRIKDPNYVIGKNGKAQYLFKSMNKRTTEKEEMIRKHSKHESRVRKSKTSNIPESHVCPKREKSTKSFAITSSTTTNGKKRKRNPIKNGDNEDDVDKEKEDNDKSGNFVLKSWNGSNKKKKRVKSQQQDLMQDVAGTDDVDVIEQNDDDENPLPGFIDTISFEVVKRPAISPYGHVMGYDSWVKCLSTGPKKNICPLTKKPLKKRELVILTKDNINQYRLVFI
ncbi:5898_t:CDS:10 [Entrophospora sp. SA101]|nr:14896_t:CDS:10 [Entrophospora sp. SA101]CAJ0769328.1 5898_t:CDS:10 [Entrophospora sp. SA101]